MDIKANTDETAGLKARALNTLGMVEYQAGSVVSRQIVKKAIGTVTLFAFDAGEGLSEHTAPFDALINVLEGEADITISGHVHRVKAGEFIVMPAHEPHALMAPVRFKMMLTMIRA